MNLVTLTGTPMLLLLFHLQELLVVSDPALRNAVLSRALATDWEGAAPQAKQKGKQGSSSSTGDSKASPGSGKHASHEVQTTGGIQHMHLHWRAVLAAGDMVPHSVMMFMCEQMVDVLTSDHKSMHTCRTQGIQNTPAIAVVIVHPCTLVQAPAVRAAVRFHHQMW
jgi:hypothetical protein